VAICVVLMTACILSGSSLALFAYRSAIAPVLTSQELADYGSSISVRIVIANPEIPNHATEYTTLSTGFWVSRKGYAITCLDKIRDHRNLFVSMHPSPYLGDHITITGSIENMLSAIIWENVQSNLAVLRTVQNPFDG